MDPTRIVVHRATHAAFSAEQLARCREGGVLEIVAYVDDGEEPRDEVADGLRVLGLAAWRRAFPEVPCAIVASEPSLRRRVAERVAAAGGGIARLFAHGPAISSTLTVGEGTILGPGALSIARGTHLGRHVLIASPASIGHDCTIGDFVTIDAGAVVSGHVVIEDDVVLGARAIVVNGTSRKPLRIARGATIHPGTVVTKDVPAGAIVEGNPGRVTPRKDH